MVEAPLDVGATVTMLLEKLLRLERPQITEQMQPLLETEEARDLFLSYLLTPPDHSPSSIKNSYWVSKLLSEDIVGATILKPMYDARFIATLFGCFRTDTAPATDDPTTTTTGTTLPTRPWIPHVCVVLSALLRGQADDFVQVITDTTASFLVHVTALCAFSSTPMVSGLLQDTVCLPSPLPGQPSISCSPQVQQLLHQRLAEMDMWYFLVSLVVDPAVPLGRSEAAADCFMTSLKRTAVNATAALLADSLIQSAGRIVDTLVTYSHDTFTHSQQVPVDATTTTRVGLCIHCLLSLLEWTMPTIVDAPSSAPYQSFGGTMVVSQDNTLHGAFQVAVVKLVELRTLIFDLLRQPLQSRATSEDRAIKHTGYVTDSPFTLVRLNLVLVLHKMLSSGVEQEALPVALMAEVPAVLWRLLGTWFCTYPHSSMYHHIFVELFALVLGSGCDIAVKGIIKRAKKKKKKSDVGFLSRIMRHYDDGDINSSVRGHILQCLNIVRLRDQVSLPTSYLSVYLRDLQEWGEFLPRLEAATLSTVAAPPFTVPVKWGELAKTDYGIELGSPWAKSLGFTVDMDLSVTEDSGDEFTVVD